MANQPRPAQGHDKPNGISPAPTGRGWRVLVVEDDPMVAESLAGLLRLDGYEVQVAGDGGAALEVFQADHPDVVLLDLGLPVLDGYAVAKQLREQKTGKRPVLIAVTGLGQREDRVRSYEAGIDLHLTKPVLIEELRQFLVRFQAISGPHAG
jgi:DNA-binding response OmpR family regulator